MFDKINLLFSACTVEDDRDSLVMQTIARLVQNKRDQWGGYTETPITDYCVGVSVDEVYAALPLTMPDGEPKPAVTIWQTIQSVDRLTHQYTYVRNPDEYEVIHLHPQLMRELQRYAHQEPEPNGVERFFNMIAGFRPTAQ